MEKMAALPSPRVHRAAANRHDTHSLAGESVDFRVEIDTIRETVIDDDAIPVLKIAHAASPRGSQTARHNGAARHALGQRRRLANGNVAAVVVVAAARNVRLAVGRVPAVVVVGAVDGRAAAGSAGRGFGLGSCDDLDAGVYVGTCSRHADLLAKQVAEVVFLVEGCAAATPAACIGTVGEGVGLYVGFLRVSTWIALVGSLPGSPCLGRGKKNLPEQW